MNGKRISPRWINSLAKNEIFVFGSNLQGMHGGGAARVAYERFGAVWGQGTGLHGQSYAIPTMHGGVDVIAPYVDEFIAFAQKHPELKFLVTEIGCGIAGFKTSEMAPLFKGALDIENIYLPERFIEKIEKYELQIARGCKEEKYALLYKQIAQLIGGESDPIANMANVAAMIHHTFGFWWTGFYRVVGEQLLLGPFQGPLACSRIAYGRGVCGTAWKKQRTQVVPDVEKFPGHIACSSESKSEIVVPLMKEGKVIAVLDIDSEHLATFDETDKLWLERIVKLM